MKSFVFNGLSVFYYQNQNGGGAWFGQDYIPVIKERYNRKFKKAYEFCSGPGFIGFSLLSNGIVDEIILSDIRSDLFEPITKTINENKLHEKAFFYNMDGVKNIPDDDVDLVVANPPHFNNADAQDFVRDYDLRLGVDENWKVHREFFKNISSCLSKDGVVLIQENALGSSIEDFKEMIECSDLEVTDVFPMKNQKPTAHIYYIELKKVNKAK